MLVTFEAYTTELKPHEIVVAKAIGRRIREFHKGRKNAVTSKRIIKAYAKRGTHIHDSSIRKMVNYLRNNGVPIVATAKGYYWPVTSNEKDQYLKSLLQRIGEISRVYNSVGRELYTDFKPITIHQND